LSILVEKNVSWRKLIWVVFIAALAAFTLAYASPALMRINGIDYGIFQYVGKGILSGQLPYRDLYDHKPPTVFYINALGLALGRGSRWGIWTLELLSLSAAGALCALYLRRYFGRLASALATAAFVLNLTFFHQGGNFTEEYALPFEFGALFFLSLWDAGKQRRLHAFLMGACAASASTLKQPLGAIAVSIGLYLLIRALEERNLRRFLSVGLLAAAGFASVWACWFAYFSLRGALPEFWEAAFAYNVALSSISIAQRLQALGTALVTLFNTAPFFMLALLSWLAAVPFLIFHDQHVRTLISRRWLGWPLLFMGVLGLYNGIFRREFIPYSAEQLGARQVVEIVLGIAWAALAVVWLRSRLPGGLSKRLNQLWQEDHTSLRLPLLIAAIDLPVQLVMISLSGNNFEHYYMSALPSLTVLCAFFFWYLSAQPQRPQAITWTLVLSLPVLLIGAAAGLQKARFSEDRYTRVIAQYVQSVTQPDDGIFYWGNLAPVYIESQRQSPSRFFFTDPLFLTGYTNRQHTTVFLHELQAEPPALIISASNAERPLLYTADPAECSALADMDTARSLAHAQFEGREALIPEGMPEVYAWICANYTPEEVQLSAEDNWVKTFYHYTPGRKRPSSP
jgi:4-amino-4-deoxy-L-arabinose transferase-like glycosyltransferase